MNSQCWDVSAGRAFRACGPISWFKDEKRDLSKVTLLATENSGAII